MLNLKIALTQSDLSGLEKALYDVSTPSSPNYGKHLSKEEVSDASQLLPFRCYFILRVTSYRLRSLLLPNLRLCRQ
jgi:hypothetical protein